MAWSEKFLCDLRRRVVQAKSYEEDDTPLRATCAIMFLGWINTSRRYGSGFIDQDGGARTWHDIPSFEECEKLIDAAAAVDGDAQWNAAIEAAAKIAKESSFPFPIEVWLNSTKKEMTALVGNAIAVAIRSLKRG